MLSFCVCSAHNNKSEEDGNGLDPSCSDLDRLCSDSYVRKLLHAAMVVNVKVSKYNRNTIQASI